MPGEQPKEDCRAAEELADATGEPESKFEPPEDVEYPDPDIEGDGRFVVKCEECGIVEFPGGIRSFASLRSADWYAGYHSGTEHPEVDLQMALATSNPDAEGAFENYDK